MSATSSSSFHLLSTALPSNRSNLRSSAFSFSPLLFPPSDIWSFGTKDKRVNFDIRPRCSAISQPRTKEYADALQQNGVPVINWQEIVEDDTEEETLKVSISNEIDKRVKSIKSMLDSMEDGEITISAYDTAWVALVRDINGSGAPQFPSSIEWIIRNQLPDGSWGDEKIFEAHDRILNTLACVIVLKSWNLHPEKCERGMAFFKDNLWKLEDEDPEHMPIGFEVAFPSLLELAGKLDIEVPKDSPILKEIYDRRNLKLTKIPKEVLHNVPTSLLHSLEGMSGLDWEKLLKLQSKDGSFLFSPASTAYALAETKDENCLAYLNRAVEKFNGGVPNVYPVDLFEHMWAVDRLQRLGISRYFQSELKECVDYVYRYWEKDGICWARNSAVHDIDDTAIGFRLLRLYGYDVSTDVFKPFEKRGEFVCFVGQSTQAVTGMYNLYRASHMMFPGEKLLEDARAFSSKFLREKQAANEVLDKWIITKDLPGEVAYALDVPYYASLPRVESRFFIDHYGGEDDVWIGKTLYRMPFVNNNEYLHLAKMDYNNCQAVHRAEWDNFQKWYEECNLADYGISRRSLLFSYFLAAATIFEPERSKERLAWAKTAMLLEAIEVYLGDDQNNSTEQRKDFVNQFKNGVSLNGRRPDRKKTRQELVKLILGTLNHLSLDALVDHGRDIGPSLRSAWEKWLQKWEVEGERRLGEAELLAQTINLTGGRWASEELFNHPDYQQLCSLTNSLCHQLGHYLNHKEHVNGSNGCIGHRITTPEIDSEMKELVQLVCQNPPGGIDSSIKQTFFAVVRSFYYAAYCDPGTINHHIAKVLFERVY